MNLHSELGREQLNGVVTMLNVVLAEECLLYSKTRNCYWNLCGAPSPPVRALLEQQYDQLSDIIDHVSDCLRGKGAQAMGTMSEFLQYARLGQHLGEGPPPTRVIAHLLDDHEAITRSLEGDRAVCAEEFKDAGTCDFLSGLMAEHERMARTLRSHLKNS
jgi:starvation-inducible DNA-binding protein